MTRQLYGFIAAIYTSSNKIMINVNNQNESNEMVSLDDIELITASPDTRLPNRFKIRVREGREFIEPWKSWLNPAPARTAPTVRKAIQPETFDETLGRIAGESAGTQSPEDFAAELMRDRNQNQE